MRAADDAYLEVDGARLRYRDEGRGPAVLLAHGWTLDLDMWEAQASALSRDFRVVRVDRRGFGLSSGVPSLAEDLADLSALYHHLALDSVAMVGMSQGARSVVHWAGTFLDRVSCLVLDAPPDLVAQAERASPADIPYAHYAKLARAKGLAAFRREWSQHPMIRLRCADPLAHTLLERMLARYPGRDLTESLPNTNQGFPQPAIESVSCPVLIINGEFDLDSRKDHAATLVSRLRRAEYVRIPAAGHLCNLDNPGAYNQALRSFLVRHTISHTKHRGSRNE